MGQQFAYFRILKPSGLENTVIEARCGDCAGECAANLVLGPGPYWDGYMEGIDYEVISARNRAELSKDALVVTAQSLSGCPFCESSQDETSRDN